MSITGIRLTDDIDKPLESLAKKLDRSENYIINQAIKEFLVKQSLEGSRWQDTLKALESIKAGKTIDETDVNAWLNSWALVLGNFLLNHECKVFPGVNRRPSTGCGNYRE